MVAPKALPRCRQAFADTRQTTHCVVRFLALSQLRYTSKNAYFVLCGLPFLCLWLSTVPRPDFQRQYIILDIAEFCKRFRPFCFAYVSIVLSQAQAVIIAPPNFAEKNVFKGRKFCKKPLSDHSCARRHTFAQKYKNKQKATNNNKKLLNVTNIFVQKCCLLSKFVV